MKKFGKILTLFFVAIVTTWALASCEPEEDPAGSDSQTIDIVNTSWKGSAGNTTTYDGLLLDVLIEVNVDFNTATEGEMYVAISATPVDYPQFSQSEEGSSPFTYTFDGTTAQITTSNKEDGETEGYMMTYHAENNTFTFYINEEEANELLGSNEIVLTAVGE